VRFYKTGSGKSPIKEFILTLPDAAKKDIVDALALLEQGQVLAMPLSRNLASISGVT
jgi:hypothetical protein